MASCRKVLVERNGAEDVPYVTVVRRYSLIGSVGESPPENSLPVYVFLVNFNLAKHLFSTSAQMATLKIRNWIKNRKSSGCTLGPTISRSLRESPEEVLLEASKKQREALCCTAGVPNNSMVRKV
ncbi:hypothetical protein TNCV_1434541 [Trichonephila clavipes]|nr:hypothetical protein TNCV_1434541 [Trichonephila clavipes]